MSIAHSKKLWCEIALMLLAVPLWPAPAAPQSPPAAANSFGSIMGALGEGSQLMAADDGEFVIDLDENRNLETFRAVRDVVVLTKDMALRCHEMTYDRRRGVLTATAAPGGLVHIQMRNVSGTGGLVSGGQTRATCGFYRFFVKKREHVLSDEPVIYQRDETGKETAVVGDLVTIDQDEQGRWRMHIKGERGRSAPRSEAQFQLSRRLRRARELWGILKPVVNIDTKPAKPAGASPTTSTRTVKIDAANLDRVRRAKSSSLVEIEQGGPTMMGAMMPAPPPGPKRQPTP